MTQLLGDDTPPSLLASLSSLCRFKRSSDYPDSLVSTVGGARSAGQGASVTGIRTHGSTPREKALRKKVRKRKRQVGRLDMLTQNLVKTVLGRGFRAMNDFHLVQVMKKHGMLPLTMSPPTDSARRSPCVTSGSSVT